MKQQKFTHKQWVLVRDSEDGVWASAQFSNMWDNLFIVVGGFAWNYCIPYEGNEHLLGTSDDYEETYIPKDGDFVVSGWEEDNRYCHWLAIARGDDNESDFYNTYAIYINRYTKDAIGEAEATVNLENSYCDSQKYVRPATEEERQLLLSKLAELGKHWNPEKKCIEDVYTPKDGDFVKAEGREDATIFIYSEKDSNHNYYGKYAGSFSGRDCLSVVRSNAWCARTRGIRPATEEEKQKLLDALHKENKDWNAEKKCIEDVWTPKDGDFVYCEGDYKHIIIFKDINGDNIISYIELLDNKTLRNPFITNRSIIRYFRPATDSEKQQLLDALHKEGKDWDPEKKEIVKYQWIPKAGEHYHTICLEKSFGGFVPLESWWSGDSTDKFNKKQGWIFKDKDPAQKKADELNNKLLKGE